LVHFQRTTRRYIPKDGIHDHRCGNLKSCKEFHNLFLLSNTTGCPVSLKPLIEQIASEYNEIIVIIVITVTVVVIIVIVIVLVIVMALIITIIVTINIVITVIIIVIIIIIIIITVIDSTVLCGPQPSSKLYFLISL
jgi:hypothetical protein